MNGCIMMPWNYRIKLGETAPCRARLYDNYALEFIVCVQWERIIWALITPNCIDSWQRLKLGLNYWHYSGGKFGVSWMGDYLRLEGGFWKLTVRAPGEFCLKKFELKIRKFERRKRKPRYVNNIRIILPLTVTFSGILIVLGIFQLPP